MASGASGIRVLEKTNNKLQPRSTIYTPETTKHAFIIVLPNSRTVLSSVAPVELGQVWEGGLISSSWCFGWLREIPKRTTEPSTAPRNQRSVVLRLSNGREINAPNTPHVRDTNAMLRKKINPGIETADAVSDAMRLARIFLTQVFR